MTTLDLVDSNGSVVLHRFTHNLAEGPGEFLDEFLLLYPNSN